MVRGLAPHPQRRYSSGSYPTAASRGDENAPPRDGFGFGFGAAPCTSTSGPTEAGGAASRLPFPSRMRPPLASSSSLCNRKPQVPVPAPTPKNGSGQVRAAGNAPARPSVARRMSIELTKKPGSGVSAAGNTPARRSVARTSLDLTKKASSSLVTRSLDLPSFKVKDSISFWEREVNHKLAGRKNPYKRN